MKLFNLGLPKSGTTTLHTALEKAGVKSAHWEFYPRSGIGLRSHQFVGAYIYRHYLRGIDPLAGMKEWDAVTQADLIVAPHSLWPQMDYALLQKIRKHHPKCLFVLLTRDPAKVANSIIRWGDMHKRFMKMGAPWLTPVMAKSEAGFHDWVVGHYERTRALFADDPHFLEVDIADAGVANTLSKRLDMELPWWGTANINTENPAN